VLARERLRHRRDLVRGARRDDAAPGLARARAHVDQVVGRAHRLLVVLHDEHRVAQVAQPLERPDELAVVALVQADGRLVQDVEDADERRADLRGEPDALRLAARQRRRRAVHRQVADAHVVEEAQALLDLPHDEPGDVPLRGRHVHLGEPLHRPAHAERGELVDRRAADEDGARLGAQPGAVARGARPHAHELLDLLPHVLGVRLAVAALEVRDDPLEPRAYVRSRPKRFL
jgi:hypothetical protein